MAKLHDQADGSTPRRRALQGLSRPVLLVGTILGMGLTPAIGVARQTAAPVAGPPFSAKAIRDKLEIGKIENDNVKAGPGVRRLYVFQPPRDSAIQLDVTSKAIDSLIEVFEDNSAEPLATDDDGGELVNARLVLPKRDYKRPLIVAIMDVDEQGGGFELRAAKIDTPATPTAHMLTIGDPEQPGTLGLDFRTPGSGYPYVEFAFKGEADQRVQIDAKSDAFNTWIELRQGSNLIARNDDAGNGLNARLLRRLPGANLYTLWVASPSGAVGDFTVRVTAAEAPGPAVITHLSFPTTVDTSLDQKSPSDGAKAYTLYALAVRAGQTIVAKLEGFDPIGKGPPPLMTLEAGALTPLGFAVVTRKMTSFATQPGEENQFKAATLTLTAKSDGDLTLRVVAPSDFLGPYRLTLEPPAPAPAPAPAAGG